MPRSKREGRGSRSAVPISGATVGLDPSGVTLSLTGLQYSSTEFWEPTQMALLDDLTGYPVEHPSAANYLVSGGSQVWGGASILITTGLSSVVSFIASLEMSTTGGASPCATQWVNHPATGGTVTAALVCQDPTAAAVVVVVSGGTIAWLAFGT